MTEIKHYGTTASELNAEKVLECRKIVRTIVEYGVTEAQKLKIIFLLALELENRDHLQEVSALVERLEAGERRSTLITEV